MSLQTQYSKELKRWKGEFLENHDPDLPLFIIDKILEELGIDLFIQVNGKSKIRWFYIIYNLGKIIAKIMTIISVWRSSKTKIIRAN